MTPTGDAALDDAIALFAKSRDAKPLEKIFATADAAPSSSLIAGLEAAVVWSESDNRAGWTAFALFRALARRREVEGDAYLVGLLERQPTQLLPYLSPAALGQVRPSDPACAPEHAAGPRVLEALARHLDAGDPLVALAAAAAYLLDRPELLTTVRALATNAFADWPAKIERLVLFMSLVAPMTPPWIDLVTDLAPNSIGLVWDALKRRPDVPSILYAISSEKIHEGTVTEFLAVLRLHADASAAPALRAVAADRYAGRPIAKRILKVAKELAR